MKSPLVSGTVTAAFDARERATRAQELAMSALNLPSAADLDRLTRRLRSVSQRIEGLEEGLDRITERLDSPRDTGADREAAGVDRADADAARQEAQRLKRQRLSAAIASSPSRSSARAAPRAR